VEREGEGGGGGSPVRVVRMRQPVCGWDRKGRAGQPAMFICTCQRHGAGAVLLKHVVLKGTRGGGHGVTAVDVEEAVGAGSSWWSSCLAHSPFPFAALRFCLPNALKSLVRSPLSQPPLPSPVFFCVVEEAFICNNSMSATSGQIAVVGMACRFPGANDIDELWDMIETGKSAIGRVPRFVSSSLLLLLLPPPVVPRSLEALLR
jgi:hypothetical protein